MVFSRCVLRRLLPLVPLPFVFAFGAWASARVADRAGADAAVALSAFAVLARAHELPPPDAEPEFIPTDFQVLAEPAEPPAKNHKAAKKARAAAAPVVFVSQKAVLGLANSGARPHGAFVPANAVRPAGLRLTGVSALGIGLLDGDVLTRAVGQPATATSAVIQAVLAARAHHAAVLEGELWRGAQRFVIRVEQPYVDERHADADGDSGAVTAAR
ncbi:MAG TPA: hypothetical protein VMI54_08120 [Polyangiaceae bacterium]|nr:hypothetical protein [Polyangiaceae bacterium]